MNHLLHRFDAQLLTALLLPFAVSAASSSRDEIVQMAPFKVTDSSGDFALDVRLDAKTKAIAQIVVTRVGPRAQLFGLFFSGQGSSKGGTKSVTWISRGLRLGALVQSSSDSAEEMIPEAYTLTDGQRNRQRFP